MESFWNACGARPPLILEVDGDRDACSIRHVSDRPFLLIGRGAQADLVLDHPDVSQRHAFLQVIRGRAFCVDLESRTGTRFEGEVSAGGWLGDDQSIQIGPYRIKARSGQAPNLAGSAVTPNPLADLDLADDPWPRSSLGLRSGGVWRSVPITRTLTLIGRSKRCEIQLATSESSRFRGALLRTPDGLWAVDLGSTKRLSVNGGSVHFAKLSTGDEIRAGSLVAMVGGPLPEPSPGRVLAPAIDSPADPSSGDLRAILDQVADIQHQSNDQLRQVIVMVTQLFGSMHRETMDLVREELEQIRTLAGELKVLRDAPSVPPPKLGPVADDSDTTGSGFPRDPAEIHLIVSERLAAFEHERRGRWSKLSRILK